MYREQSKPWLLRMHGDVYAAIARTLTQRTSRTATAKWSKGHATDNEAALSVGGYGGGSPLALNESWNGTSWTEVGDLNTAREQLGGAGASSTSALAFGGEGPPFQAKTEDWNGVSWSETSDLPVATQNLSSNGTATAAVAASGAAAPGDTTAAYLWSGSSTTIKVLTD